ncbi:MAG TPA: alpha-E domain-containing protein [Tepidisphaeraceae bacterium]|nr:alpha-E domain-containing protein [Tepidisphaeraceae bacterium]
MSTISLPAIPKFSVHVPSRPMMARDADSMFWTSRYIERAEHVARLLLVNANLLIDVGDLAPKLLSQHWQSVLTIMRTEPPAGGVEGTKDMGARIAHYMTFDRDNANSLLTCVSRARENARGIRENISAEMWEALNTLYWSIRGDDAPSRFEESPDDFYRQLMTGSMLFQGLTDQTLDHDQRWLFTQVAKYLERIDVTCRVIETKYNILQSGAGQMDAALKNIQWMAVLRSCCSIEAYRRHHLGEMDPLRVATFLVLERNFPRSVRYAVGMAREALCSIRNETSGLAIDPAERLLGRLNAQLEYAEPSEVMKEGIPTYVQKIQAQVAEAGLEVQKRYFLY